MIDNEFEQLAYAREDAEDINFQFEEAKKNMTKRLHKRMLEIGLTKKAVDLTAFSEFNIKDMFN